jgi:hypothetical protein
MARTTTSTTKAPSNSDSRAVRACAPTASNACMSKRWVRPFSAWLAVMIDNSGTRRSRPTPSKVEAITASAAAQTPFKPAKAAKSRTKAIACRTRPECISPDCAVRDFARSGLFIGTIAVLCRACYLPAAPHAAPGPGPPRAVEGICLMSVA